VLYRRTPYEASYWYRHYYRKNMVQTLQGNEPVLKHTVKLTVKHQRNISTAEISETSAAQTYRSTSKDEGDDERKGHGNVEKTEH